MSFSKYVGEWMTMKQRDIYVPVLRNNLAMLESFISEIDSPGDSRGPEHWSIARHLAHIAETQEMLFHRLEAFLENEHPRFDPFFPVDEEADKREQPVEVLLGEFSSWRKKQIEIIEGAGEEIWLRSAEHPEYMRYGFEILVRHIALHDSFHMYRMEELWITRDEYLSEL